MTRGSASTSVTFPRARVSGTRSSIGYFCHITENWRGTALMTFETIVDRIGNTRTATGLRVQAQLDAGQYPTGVKVTKSQMDQIALIPDGFHGEWNYELLPR